MNSLIDARVINVADTMRTRSATFVLLLFAVKISNGLDRIIADGMNALEFVFTNKAFIVKRQFFLRPMLSDKEISGLKAVAVVQGQDTAKNETAPENAEASPPLDTAAAGDGETISTPDSK